MPSICGYTQQSERVELRRFIEAVRRGIGDDLADLAGGNFDNWEAALRFVAAAAADEPLLVVLDEVPYLSDSTPGFPSIVQVVWDHLTTGRKLMLVLTGSSIGFMSRVLGAGGALMGRPTLRHHLEPFSLHEAGQFLPTLAAEDLVEAYAACGGYPLHLTTWDPTQSTTTNLLNLAATAGGILREDAEAILREELSASGVTRKCWPP